LLVLGVLACAPASSLENLPPPCIGGYSPCATTGLCVPKGADVEAEAKRERECGYLDREVRQGGSLVVAVPGASASNLPKVTTGSPDLIATPRIVGKVVVVDVAARHGAALGDIPDHQVTIAATIGGRLYERTFVVLVQAIAASPEGDDANVGSESEPFRTFRKAASVAERGDTIFLRNDYLGRASEPAETGEISITAGVTVRGQVPSHDRSSGTGAAPASDTMTSDVRGGMNGTILSMPIKLAGSATLDNLRLAKRLTIQTPDATVLLNDVAAYGGITVSASANHATVGLTGSSTVQTDSATTPEGLEIPNNPILFEADDATLSIDGATVVQHGNAPGNAFVPVPALKLVGRRQHLGLGGVVRIHGLKGPVAIQIDDAQTVEITGRDQKPDRLTILGRVDITGVDSMVTVTNATFARGIDGSGIVFKGAGNTSSMLIEDTVFGDEGIVIDGLQSKVTVRRTEFQEITTSGIRLMSGTLDLGTALEAGKNKFWMKDNTNPDHPIPVALQIDADEGEAIVTSSASTYQGMDPGRCAVTGPLLKESIVRGFVKIANAITIEFF
jgi:hypothetical protein